jgi:hypothetical protein
MVQVSLGIKQDPISKNEQYKQGWGCGSSGRVPAQQAHGPRYHHQEERKERKMHCHDRYSFQSQGSLVSSVRSQMTTTPPLMYV